MSNVIKFPRTHIPQAFGQSEALFGEWLAVRAHRYLDRPGTTLDDELASEARRTEFALRLAPMPAAHPHHILHKLQVLEAELLDFDLIEGHVVHALVAGIKADLAQIAATL